MARWTAEARERARGVRGPGGWRDVLQQLPNDPSLSGVTFFAQAVLRDPIVTGAWWFTDGLEIPIQ